MTSKLRGQTARSPNSCSDRLISWPRSGQVTRESVLVRTQAVSSGPTSSHKGRYQLLTLGGNSVCITNEERTLGFQVF